MLAVIFAPVGVTLQPDPARPSSGRVQLAVLLHVCAWVLVLFCDRVMQYFHARSRLCGYLRFYRKTRLVRMVPFVALSCGAVVLWALDIFWRPSPSSCAGWPCDYMDSIQLVYCLEMAAVLPLLMLYIGSRSPWPRALRTSPLTQSVRPVRVHRFNCTHGPPDALEDALPSLMPSGDHETLGVGCAVAWRGRMRAAITRITHAAHRPAGSTASASYWRSRLTALSTFAGTRTHLAGASWP